MRSRRGAPPAVARPDRPDARAPRVARPPRPRRSALLRAARQPLRCRDRVLQHPHRRAAAHGRFRGGELRPLVQSGPVDRAGERDRRLGALGAVGGGEPDPGDRHRAAELDRGHRSGGCAVVGGVVDVEPAGGGVGAVGAARAEPGGVAAAALRPAGAGRAGRGAGRHARVHGARRRAGRARARVAGRTGRRLHPHPAAAGRHRARRRRQLADLRLGDHPAAPHGRRAARRAAGGVARRRRLRGDQAGGGGLLRGRSRAPRAGRSSAPCSACCSSATWWPGCCCGSRRGRPPRGATSASPRRPCRGRWCCARSVVAGGPSTGGLGAALLLGIAAGAWLRGRSR